MNEWISQESDEVTGLNVYRNGSQAFDVYAIGIPGEGFTNMDHSDGLIDLFVFNVLGINSLVAGRVLLFDVRQRLESLPPQLQQIWAPHLVAKYTVVLQTAPENEWYDLGQTETLGEAQQLLVEWMDKIRPGKPIQVPVGRDLRTLWESDLPGLRTFHVFNPPNPYSTTINLN